MKICIIDYGMGNLKSIRSAFKYLGVDEILLSNDYRKIKSSDKLLLPGVGSFGKAMKEIKNQELDKILKEVVLEDKKSIMGICLGMQLLCNHSEEGNEAGLGFINAECKKFISKDLKIPHVGFNQVTINPNSKLFVGFSDKSDFYFTHSYKVQSKEDINQSICSYEEDFIASYEKDNIYGTQFHPELSQLNGLKLLKNFVKMC